jgi:hypothetical protein
MSADFLVWRDGALTDGICKLDGLSGGVTKSFQIHQGISRLAGWSPDASSAMNPDWPKDIGLADSMSCENFPVVSAKAKDFFAGESAGKIEFLPIKIINHKGRVASDSYFVVNPLDIVDCIDKDASVVKMNPINKQIKGCKQLVLKADAIPPELKIFRLKDWPDVVVIRRELAVKAEKEAGLTNLKFYESATYDGMV